jgi:threonine/homoserine/homoserine lactone efflux protein
VLLSWLGIGAVLLALPGALAMMRWACFAYLLWLAWQVLRDTGTKDEGSNARAQPMSMASAAVFQLVNPKAWMMAVTGITAFTTGRPGGATLGIVIATLVSIGTVSLTCWALWGATVHRVLRRPAARRTFNVAMAAVVAGTAVSTLGTS